MNLSVHKLYQDLILSSQYVAQYECSIYFLSLLKKDSAVWRVTTRGLRRLD